MMELSEAAHIVDGKLKGANAQFTAVVTDSRAIDRGDLFIAIPGEKFDGHDFVSEAASKGAVGAMVSSSVATDLAQIKVADTTRALGELASQWRSRFKIPILAITGSNGKTTVTAMVASILNRRGNCLFPERSFNNQWGVPLTLLKLDNSHNFAVIEMGTNHIGEIDYLSKITNPTIALITNVAPAHLEGLNSLEQIAQAKAEIFSGLAENGTAVINADDDFGEQWSSQANSRLKDGHVISFGLVNPAAVTATNITTEWFASHFDLRINEKSVDINLSLPGRHNVMNALAAAAICYEAGASMDAIKDGLNKMQGVSGRLNLRRGLKGSMIIDDSYNANPQSVMAGIDVLAEFRGVTILVLGAMAELGKVSSQWHNEIGLYAKQKGIDVLLCLAPKNHAYARDYADGFGEGSKAFESMDMLVDELQAGLGEGVAVLVKGSRSSMMERLVAQVVEVGKADDIRLHNPSASQGGNAPC